MRKIIKKINTDEKGLTLAELLASIVILSIILISIITIFTQTMKTNRMSGEIVDATYIAQTEMEKMYEISKQGLSSLPEDYTLTDEKDEEGWEVYEKKCEGMPCIIQIKKKENKDHPEMIHIIVQIYEESDLEEIKAQMENLYKWGADE